MKYLTIFLLLTLSLLAKVPDIVPITWLQKHYNDNNLILIDIRSHSSYTKGHLKNAVNIPALKKLFNGPKMLLPPLSQLKELFSQAGIDIHSNIVVYGGVNPMNSARFYWISKVLGAENVGILAVSYGNWSKNALPTSTQNFQSQYKDFIPKINNNFLETKFDVLTSINKAYIIDGRPFEFYIGKKSHAKRYGHIIKAFNFPGSLTYKRDGTKSIFKSFKELKKIYSKLPHDKPIILYCEDGADAALNFLVLKKLGYKASVYDGSWLEWGNDKHLPIETKINKL